MPANALVFMYLASGANTLGTPTYRVDDLSALLPSPHTSVAVDVADNGTITGSFTDSTGRRKPFVLDAGGALQFFDGGYYDDRIVRAGNANGLIIGSLPGSTLGWVRISDELRCIPSPFDCESIQSLYTSSLPYDINDAGTFVGSLTIVVSGQPYVFQGYRASVGPDHTISVTGLGQYQQRWDTTASAINENEEIVGFAVMDRASADYQPVFLSQGEWLPLGDAGRYQTPIALNQHGVVIGSKRTNDGYRELPLRWSLHSPEQTAVPLPTLPSSISARPNGINAAGEIVGLSYDPDHPSASQAWLLIGDDLFAIDDLVADNPGWRVLAAHAINSRGDIAAAARWAGEAGARAVVLRRQSDAGLFRHGFDVD
jgi:hypothetical protein